MIWWVSSVPNPDRTTRRWSARPSWSVSARWSSSVPLRDVGAAVADLDAGRDQEAVGEDLGLFRLAVAVGVGQDHDLVVGGGVGLELGIRLGAGDPEPASGVEVDLGRLSEQGVGGEEVDLVPLGDVERGSLGVDVGVDHLGHLLGGNQEPAADQAAQYQPLADPAPPGRERGLAAGLRRGRGR